MMFEHSGLFRYRAAVPNSATNYWRARKERVTLHASGITVEDRRGRSCADWDQVTRIDIGRPRLLTKMPDLLVRTDERTLRISGFLEGRRNVQALIRQYARRVSEYEREAKERDIVGGENSRWSSGSPGAGNRVFHYNTGANRKIARQQVILIGGTLLLFWVSMSVGVLRSNGMDLPALLLLGAIFLLFLGLAALVDHLKMRQFGVMRIEISGAGISMNAPFSKEVFIRWEDVRDYYRTAEGGYVVRAGKGQAVRFSKLIIDLDELLAAIQAHAVNSASTKWETRNESLRVMLFR